MFFLPNANFNPIPAFVTFVLLVSGSATNEILRQQKFQSKSSRAVNRTLAKIDAIRDEARLVILFCKNQCPKQRSNVSKRLFGAKQDLKFRFLNGSKSSTTQIMFRPRNQSIIIFICFATTHFRLVIDSTNE